MSPQVQIDETCYRQVDWLVWKLPSSIRQDCRQAALLGIVQGLPKFDPAKAQFRTFTSNCARWALADYLRSQDVVSRQYRRKIRNGEEMGFVDCEITEAMHLRSWERSPETELIHSQVSIAGWGRLNQREAFTLRALFFEDLSVPQVAHALGLSAPRIWQIREGALAKLRRAYSKAA